MSRAEFRKREGKIFIDIRHDSDGLANNCEPRSPVFGRNRVLQCSRGIDFRIKRGGLEVSADDHRVVFAERRQVAQNGTIQLFSRKTILNFRLEFANRSALFLARTKTRKLLFARFRSGAAGFAVTTKGLTLTGLRVPIERLTLTGLTVTAERFALTVAWRTPVARERLAFSRLRIPIERLTFPRLRIASVRLALSRLRIATKRLPFSGFRIPIERLTLTVAGWSLAAGTIAIVFGRAKTARTRFAR